MAGHEFRLEQVLKFRKEVEKMHQLELAAARLNHENAQDKLESEQAAMATMEQDFSRRQMQGIEAKDLQLYGNFSMRKSREIQAIKESLPVLEKAVQEKREALLTAAKDKKALEVFKEKKMRDLKMDQLTRERIFLDEIALQGRGAKK